MQGSGRRVDARETRYERDDPAAGGNGQTVGVAAAPAADLAALRHRRMSEPPFAAWWTVAPRAIGLGFSLAKDAERSRLGVPWTVASLGAAAVTCLLLALLAARQGLQLSARLGVAGLAAIRGWGAGRRPPAPTR